MELAKLEKVSEFEWRIAPFGAMRVPGIIYASEALLLEMDEKVYEQVCNVAKLPGIMKASYAMPDAHWGYGFPIGGVAAFDPNEGGIISAGGVGFDISCGVRMLRTKLSKADILENQRILADRLFQQIPSGVGSHGEISLSEYEMNEMLRGGARWAVAQGYGREDDLLHVEEKGKMEGAMPEEVSPRAKERQRREMGTLGSGNHYLEVQLIDEIYDHAAADAFGIAQGSVVVSIHCGSRGLGHQIGGEFLRSMAIGASSYGIELPDRELACAPIRSELGASYLGAMRAGINCALANRQILTHLTRKVFASLFPGETLPLLYDVSHNTCKEELHVVDGISRRLFVHRKGATRAFGPGHPSLPESYFKIGQPVIIGGSMGTNSFVLVGTLESERRSFSSACHGAGRRMSRKRALKQWSGRELMDDLAAKGILIRALSTRGVAEEAPAAYKDVTDVVDAAHEAHLAAKVARARPLICVKG